MMDPHVPLCFSWPFSLVFEPGRLHLIAGEDVRYSLVIPEGQTWIAEWLSSFSQPHTVQQKIAALAASDQPMARGLLDRLCEERILVPATALQAHQARACRMVAVGEGEWPEAFRMGTPVFEVHPAAEPRPVQVLFQDRLDYDEALQFNQRQLQGSAPWMWVSSGAGARGYVSPIFLPHIGPCLGCLLLHFQERSSTPWVYDAMVLHKQRGGEIKPMPFSVSARNVLQHLAQWKWEEYAKADPSPGVYQLHVLELDAFEITSHEVWSHPGCAACGGRR